MAIFFHCPACAGEHPHTVSLTRQTFESLQATPHITWLHDWSLCPSQARVVEVRSQDLVWRDGPGEYSHRIPHPEP